MLYLYLPDPQHIPETLVGIKYFSSFFHAKRRQMVQQTAQIQILRNRK